MKHFLTIIFLFLGTSILACICAPIRNLEEKQENEFKSSDLIFIGVAVEANENGNQTLKIIELLKGENAKMSIEAKTNDYCIVIPRINNGYYLIYANRNKDGTITIDGCGLSRSFEFPYLSGEKGGIFPPPSKVINDPTMAMIDYEKTKLEYKTISLNVLSAEIKELRRKRDK